MKKPVRQKPANSQATGKPPVNAHRKDTAVSGSSIYSFIERNNFAVTTGVVISLIIVIFHDFIFANLYYLFRDIGSDSLNFTYPYLVSISNYLRKEGFPLWSFYQGIGQIVANGMNDPFTWIAYIGGSENVAYSMILIEITKILITSAVFYKFLKYWNFSPVANIIGTVLYSFSGFIVIGSGWSVFTTEACYLAVLLLSFEQLYQKGSWYLFPVAIFLIAVFQPFDLYIYGLFLILYFLLRHFSGENPLWKKFLKTVRQMTVLGLLGIMMSCFFLVLYIQIIIASPRVGGNSSYFNYLFSHSLFFTETPKFYMTELLRLFHNDIVGNGSKYYGWYNYLEAPLFYIGIIPLMLLPQFFFIENRRKAIVYGIYFMLILFILIFPFFRYIIWAFTGDYFRGFSLFVTIPLLLAGLSAFSDFNRGKKINPYVLGATLVVWLAVLYFPYKDAGQLVRNDVQANVRNVLIVYAAILFMFSYKSYNQVLGLICLLMVFIEAGVFNFQSLKERDIVSDAELKQKAGYNDFAVEAVKYLKNYDHQFYRINKGFTSSPTIHESYNDGMAQGFYGTRSYYSFNQKYYIRFLEEMFIIKKGNEQMSRWVIGLWKRPLLQNIASTKYQLIKGKAEPPVSFLYDSITSFGDVKVLKNKLFMPLGFTYDSIVRFSVFSKISPMAKEVVMQKACVIDDSVTKPLSLFPVYARYDTVGDYTLSVLKEDAKKKAGGYTSDNEVY